MSLFRDMAAGARSAHAHFFATSITLAEPGSSPRNVKASLYKSKTETVIDQSGNQNRVTVRMCRFIDLTTVRHDATVTIGADTWIIDEVMTYEASGLYVKLKQIAQRQTTRTGYRGRG